MQRGIGRLDSEARDGGTVLLEDDDREKCTVSAMRYVVEGMKPPLFELPKIEKCSPKG